MAPGVEVDKSCGSCGKCVSERQYGMGCEGLCAKWFHIGCAGLVKKDYEKFMGLGDKSVWYCSACKPKVQDLIAAALDSQNSPVLRNGNVLVNTDKSSAPALSVVLDEITSLNSIYFALERRINDLELSRDKVSCGNDVIVVNEVTAEACSVTKDVNQLNCQPLETKSKTEEQAPGALKSFDTSKKSPNRLAVSLWRPLDLGDGDGKRQVKQKKEETKRKSQGNHGGCEQANGVVTTQVSCSKTRNSPDTVEQEWKTVRGRKNKTGVSAASPGEKLLRKEVIIGTQADENTKLTSAEKPLCIFVSRLGVSVEGKDVADHIEKICGSVKVSWDELKPKYPGYRSYKVELPFSSKNTVFNPVLWPKDVLVSKFIFPRINKRSSLRPSPGNISFLGAGRSVQKSK